MANVNDLGIPYFPLIQSLTLIAEFEDDWHRAEGCRWFAEHAFLWVKTHKVNLSEWFGRRDELRQSLEICREALDDVKRNQERCAPPEVDKRKWFREEYVPTLSALLKPDSAMRGPWEPLHIWWGRLQRNRSLQRL